MPDATETERGFPVLPRICLYHWSATVAGTNGTTRRDADCARGPGDRLRPCSRPLAPLFPCERGALARGVPSLSLCGICVRGVSLGRGNRAVRIFCDAMFVCGGLDWKVFDFRMMI